MENQAQRITQAQAEQLDKVVEMMEKPMEYYQSAPVEGEFELLSYIREQLVKAGLGDRIHFFDNSRFIQDAHNRPAHAQQFCIIRWLTLQFMHAEDCEETRLARYALIYEVNPAEFVVIFKQKILPVLVNFGLPVAA